MSGRGKGKNSITKNSQYQDFAHNILKYCGDVEGLRILDVACDSGAELLKVLVHEHNAKEGIGTNLKSFQKTISPDIRIESDDITESKFPDNHFDLIVSLAAFEHINNFDKAIKEMYRLLKPGGLVYSLFGPVWSCIYGHHLWIHQNDRVFNYSNTILPPYCHLLLDEGQVYNHCLKFFDEDLSQKIVNFVFKSTAQNKLFFDDYERMIRRSPFEVIFLKGDLDEELCSKYLKGKRFEDFHVDLKKKYENYKNFTDTSITLLLKKNKQKKFLAIQNDFKKFVKKVFKQ